MATLCSNRLDFRFLWITYTNPINLRPPLLPPSFHGSQPVSLTNRHGQTDTPEIRPFIRKNLKL